MLYEVITSGTETYPPARFVPGSPSSSVSSRDDVPFAITATVHDAAGHSHGARCGLGAGMLEVEGGLAFHRIAPMGSYNFV